MQFIKFPSIEQFRHVVKDITHDTTFAGLDENAQPIYVNSLLPTVEATLTIKLHGTNAAIGYDGINLWSQSRNRILTISNDHLSFASYVANHKSQIITTLQQHSLTNHVLFGEWCGKGIQKGVGVSELPRMFVAFALYDLALNKFIDLPHSLFNPDMRLYNIYQFQTYQLTIDFTKASLAQKELTAIVQNVEKQCPVALALGKLGIGEGVVGSFTYNDKRYRFKVKGEEHFKASIKAPKLVNIENLDTINKCVQEITHVWRCNQALTEIFGPNFETTIDIRKIGDYFKWIMQDTIKEESDILEKYNLTMKDVQRALTQHAKEHFMLTLNKEMI